MNYKLIFLMSKDVISLYVIFNLKWWLSVASYACLIRLLTFIIDFSSFHNGIKHLCSLKLVSIIRATLWKVVKKCKIVMLLNFCALFLKIFIFEVAKFYLIKPQISNHPVLSGSLYLWDSCFWWGYSMSNYTKFLIMSPLSHGCS